MLVDRAAFFEDIDRFGVAFEGRFQGTGADHDTETSTAGLTPHALWQNVHSIGGATSEGDVIAFDLSDLHAIAIHAGRPMVAVHEDGIHLGNAADRLSIREPISFAPSSWGRLKFPYRDR